MSVFPQRIVLKNTTDSLATTIQTVTADSALLLHFDGSNGSTAITNEGLGSNIVTASGNAQISTAQSKFGGSSLLLNGSTSYLSCPDAASLELGGNNFTIEFWCRANSTAAMAILSKDTNANVNFGNLYIGTNGASNITFYCNPNSGNATGRVTLTSTSGSAAIGNWIHVAVSRSGGNWYLFINGTLEASATSSVVFRDSTALLYLGCMLTSSSPSTFFNGYIDEFRFTNGLARYTSNFTPQTTQFEPQPNQLANGEVVLQRSSGEVRVLANTTSGTISQLNPAIKNENKGSLTVTNSGYGSTSFVLNDGSVTGSKIADNSITEVKLSGAIAIANGGTGGTTRDTALTSLLPSQTGNANRALTTDSSNVTWQVCESSTGSNDLPNSDFVTGTISINNLNDVNTVVAVNRTGGAFNGTSSYLTLPANAVLALGTGDFTVETWVYITAYNNYSIFDTIPIGGTGSRVNAMVWYITSAGKLQVFSNGADRGASGAILPLNQWNHIALVRSGTTWRYYINGVKDVVEYTYSVTLSLATGCVIGRLGDSAAYFLNGNLDNFRVTKGLARYSANFVPSPYPFPEGVNDADFSKVSLLLRMDGVNGSTAFTDTSTNALAVTAVSGAQITSTAYTTTQPPNDQCLRWDPGTSNWVPTVDVTSLTPLSPIAPGKPGQISKDLEYLYICIALNTWRRIPYSVWNYTLLRVPNLLSAGLTFVPKAGVVDPDWLSVSLLLRFDGANGSNVYTDSSLNAFTGSPQAGAALSTTEFKFGGSSGFFNGSSQYVIFANNSAFHFGSGNFTIEAWIRRTSVSGEHCICSHSFGLFAEHSFTFSAFGNSGMLFRLMDASGISIVADYIPSFTLAVNTWYHVAAVRNGNLLRIFVNGALPPTDLSITTALHSPPSGNSTFKIGASNPFNNNTPSRFFVGYIDDLRITKGVARYWTAFTPPANAFPNK